MTDDVILRQATLKDLPSIVSMLNRMYTYKRPEKFLRWQFFESIMPTVLMCGLWKNELVGIFGIQKRMLVNNLRCGQVSWINISPSWQGKGYFPKLGKLAINYFTDLDVLCVFANSHAKSACERSLGFKIIGILQMMVLDSIETVAVEDDVKCEPITQHTVFPKFDEGEYTKIMFQHSQNYRLWRYALNPLYTYSIVRLPTDEFAVIKKFIDPGTKTRFGDIVDFECSLNDKEKLTRLFTGACRHLKNLGVERITTWAMLNTLLRKVVEKIGFRESHYEAYFAIKILKPEYDYLYDFSMWHLREADATNY